MSVPRVLAAPSFVSVLGLGLLLVAAPGAQQPRPDSAPPLLREARPGEAWITSPTIGAVPPAPTGAGPSLVGVVTDTTPPTAPGDLVVETNGLFRIIARWTPSSDPESGIDYYAFALGTGTTPDTEADVRYWQSNGTRTTIGISMALTEGATYYLNVRANNGVNLSSTVVHSLPVVPARRVYGRSTDRMTYQITPTGFGADGGVIPTWDAARTAQFSDFMDKMLPVLADLYGPPSSSYQVAIVRDLRYVSSAIFFPSTDEIHVGDTVTYQLLTHEMIHAMRRDRVLSSGNLWQYDPTLSGFEEGFAQAVSYDAMTEFARRYPAFGLTQQIYGSSHEWDYDFQNLPELRTTDFWSDTGGMLLHYARYEVAAAAIAKIELEHPGFYRAFNAEFYRRVSADPRLTMSRALVADIIGTVASTIEGRPALAWIGLQNVFDCQDHPGRKIWLLRQNYPASEYFIFNRVFFYETFSNGSDWAYPDGQGGYRYHSLNGSTGAGTLRTSAGAAVWQKALAMSPPENPPAYLGFGLDEVNLTTQATNLPWPGGDATKFVTSLLPFDVYQLSVQFTAAGQTTSNSFYHVIGAPLRNTRGVWGGIVGAQGGTISLRHRQLGSSQTATLTGGAFWMAVPWASLDHPLTQSNDSTPGVVDVLYVDATGNAYSDVRTIGWGSSSGTQAFLFDVSRMTLANVAPTFVTQAASQSIGAGQAAVFSVSAAGVPAPAYRWQLSTNAAASWADMADGVSTSGAATPTLTLTGVAAALNGAQLRAVATNAAGSVASAPATLTVFGPASVSPPALAFGATTSGGTLVSATGSQTVTVNFSGAPSAWSASASQPWLQVTSGSAVGSGRFAVSLRNPADVASATTLAAAVTITSSTAPNAPVTIPIALSIVPLAENAAPVGAVDTPLDNAAGLTGSIAITGWALDDGEVTRVRIARDPVAGEPAGLPVYLGDASLVDGARPDLIAGFGALPRNARGGWGYLLLTNMLPNQGNGTYTLHAYADDADGHATLLGTRTITCDNLMATAPFGAIDTPGQGETVSGIVNNFGWVLSPGSRRADPPGGGSVTVYIDNVPVGSPSGWVERVDLTQLFPPARYSGVTHALAVFTFDSRLLSNGLHTISWVVTDNMGEAAGIGSRYFTIANGTGQMGGQVSPGKQ